MVFPHSDAAEISAEVGKNVQYGEDMYMSILQVEVPQRGHGPLGEHLLTQHGDLLAKLPGGHDVAF